MQYALSAAEALRAEQEAVSHGAVTIDGLMERAGNAIAETVLHAAPGGPVAVVAGKGNNGGDGWVAARVLREAGRDVHVFTFAAQESLSGAAKSAARAAVEAGVAWSAPESALDLAHGMADAAVVVDALFGFGFKGEATGEAAAAIIAIDDSDAFVVAADLPSGVHADTGVVRGVAVHADITVTFSAPKIGLLLEPGASHAGEVVVAEIGVPRVYVDREGRLEIWDRGDYRGALPLPAPEDHKGSRGRVLVVAGSRAYAGAAVLTAGSAARMGAGYVYAAVPSSIAPTLQSALPHVITRALPESAEGALSPAAFDTILSYMSDVDAVVVGPGLTMTPYTVSVMRRLVAETNLPMVVDADALNAFDALGPGGLSRRSAPTVLTPHPGELARLLGSSVESVQADRLAAAASVAGGQVVCLLKGARSIVAGDGRMAVTLSGNPGMATAGTGDVLAGMIGTLLAQHLAPYDAAALGAYVHGRAGDLGAAEMTATCLTASDLERFVPAAVKELLA